VIITSVFVNRNRASLAKFNPFTDKPVEGVNWAKDPNFGKPNNPDAYGNATSLNPDQVPRTYRFAVGLRF
jgi:hypothetical protein